MSPPTPRSTPRRRILRRPRRALPAWAALMLLVVLVPGCEVSPTESGQPLPSLRPAPPAPVEPVVPDRPLQSYHDLTLQLVNYTDEQLQAIASCDMATFAVYLLLSDEAQPALARLRALNPDMVFLGVMPVLSSIGSWDHPNWQERFPLGIELHDLFLGHYARRTDGQVATMWEDAPMVNPWLRGEVNEALLVNMVNLIGRHAADHPGVLDGIFHDYTSGTPYLWPRPEDPSVGVDLDGDGVAAVDDPQENAVWVAWQYRLVESLQEVFGEGFLQVANGRLPLQDAGFARLLAGIHYERFPTTPWNYSPRAGVELVIAHSEAGYLTPRRGRTWNHVLDVNSWNWELLRATALLTGQSYSFWDDAQRPTVDPAPIDPGEMLGTLVRSELPDGTVFYQRRYEAGTAQVRFSRGGSLLSVDFVAPQ